MPAQISTLKDAGCEVSQCPLWVKSRHVQSNTLCPLWARSGHCGYSITSSARAIRAGGAVRPIALAVFWLITISYLDACSTGRSLGLEPFRILSLLVAVGLGRSLRSAA